MFIQGAFLDKASQRCANRAQVSASIGTHNKSGVSSKELQDEEQKAIGHEESFACRDQWTSKEGSSFEKVFYLALK